MLATEYPSSGSQVDWLPAAANRKPQPVGFDDHFAKPATAKMSPGVGLTDSLSALATGSSAQCTRLPTPEARYAASDHEPKWSPQTLALLAALRPLERRFVEYYTSGCSGAESYRRASGRVVGEGVKAARQHAYKVRRRPRVAIALRAMLSEQSIAARCDEVWLMSRLRECVEDPRNSKTVSGRRIALNALRQMSRIQREIEARLSARRLPAAFDTPNCVRVDQQVAEIIAEAKQAREPVSSRPAAAAVNLPTAASQPADSATSRLVDEKAVSQLPLAAAEAMPPVSGLALVAPELKPYLMPFEPESDSESPFGRGFQSSIIGVW
jgi:hypothetical protein